MTNPDQPTISLARQYWRNEVLYHLASRRPHLLEREDGSPLASPRHQAIEAIVNAVADSIIYHSEDLWSTIFDKIEKDTFFLVNE